MNHISNDLFFVCSLIDYIARKTKNKRIFIIQKIGKDRISKIYDLADIYHSYNIDQVSATKNIEVVDALFEVYGSFVCDLIDDYNGSFYYENPQYILSVYLSGKVY